MAASSRARLTKMSGHQAAPPRPRRYFLGKSCTVSTRSMVGMPSVTTGAAHGQQGPRVPRGVWSDGDSGEHRHRAVHPRDQEEPELGVHHREQRGLRPDQGAVLTRRLRRGRRSRQGCPERAAPYRHVQGWRSIWGCGFVRPLLLRGQEAARRP